MSEALRVLRHESELGTWELVTRAPETRLRGLVCDYQGYVESGAPSPVLRQQVPTPRIPLIVNLGAPWNVAGAEHGEPQAHESFVAGLGERSSYVAATGPASCVQVNLTPLGAFMFFGVAMHELANQVIELEDLLPRHGRGLARRLEDAAGWSERFDLLDALFAARFAEARAPSDDVAWAWRILDSTHGKAPIGWICDRLGRSRRHLATRFGEQIGLRPKTVGRILRFDRAVELLGRDGADLADVAFECGYYDQAHLNRDFREFAGKPPGVFMRQIVPDGGVVVSN
jgi:AraC-like DNA-binding protein